MTDSAAPASKALACVSVVKSFGERRALDRISLEVRPGEVHAVLGPSGSGKTTLLRIMNLLEVPDAGEVTFNGSPVQLVRLHPKLEGERLAARLACAMVPQKPVAFRRTVFENAAFGLRVRGVPHGTVRERVTAALAAVGLDGLSGAPARRLSGGEQQRLAFARATVLGVDFLLLDEFSANLDPRNIKILEEAARAFAAGGGGVLLVTHDVFQARRLADRASLLVDGRIVESGPKSAFFEAPVDPRTRAFIAGELAV